MSRAAKSSLIALAVLLTLVGYASRPDPAAYGETSFGELPRGFGALFDLMVELGTPVARSYAPPGALPPEATVWWIRPEGLCGSAEAAEQEAPAGLPHPGAALEAWVRGGGTAVVFLGAGPCRRLAGLDLPDRAGGTGAEADEGAAPVPDEEGLGPRGAAVATRLAGPLPAGPRTLETPPLAVFEGAPAGWRPLASTEAGAPFVLERRLGAGRLVLAAEPGFLRNRWLGRADAAPLAFDFVRAFGAPLLDERSHGLRAHRSGARYLMGSPAALLFVGLGLFGLAHAWRGASLPPRSVDPSAPEAPTLDAFVDSLASLYARTREHDRVLEHYRELTALRLRKLLDLPAETPTGLLVERLRRGTRAPEPALRLLAEGRAVRREGELRAAVAELDGLVEEAAA